MNTRTNQGYYYSLHCTLHFRYGIRFSIHDAATTLLHVESCFRCVGWSRVALFSFGTHKPEVKFCSVRAPLTGGTSAWTHQAESKWVGGAARLPVEKGQIKSAGQVAGAGNSSIEGKNILPSQSLGHVLGLLPSFGMVTVPSVFFPLEPAHITNWHVSHIWGGGRSCITDVP